MLYLRQEGEVFLIFGGIVLLASALIIVYGISFFCRSASHDLMAYMVSSRESKDLSTLNSYLVAGNSALYGRGAEKQEIYVVTINEESITVTSSTKKREKTCEQIRMAFAALTDMEQGIRKDAFYSKKYREVDLIVITLNGITGQFELHAYANNEEICDPLTLEMTKEDPAEGEAD
ncbi:MAG: hypothetical protein IJL09_10715 [Lachnospiraceae bacterium]|nr:hypothetical protein [Lachnospiraceae bacterium]